MKLLLDPQIFSWQAYGGISNQFATLFKIWQQQNLPVDLPVNFSYNAYLYENKHLLPNAKLINYPDYKNTLWSKAGRVGKLIQNQTKFGVSNIYKANNAAAIHALQSNQYTIFQSTYFDPYFLPYLGKTKLVAYIPDMIPELYSETVIAGVNKLISQKKLLANHAHSILTISKESKENIVNLLNINPNKVFVVYLASGLDGIVANIASPQDFKFAMHVGDRAGYKNWQFMLTSIAPVLKQYNIKLINSGGGAFTTLEKQLIADLQLQGLVTQVSLSPQDLANHYSSAIALLAPSYAEGFGITPIEAMQFGCPVIASNTSCMPEVLGQAAILLDPKDSTSWQAQLESLVKSKPLDLITKGYAQNAKYSFETTAKQTWQLYESIAND